MSDGPQRVAAPLPRHHKDPGTLLDGPPPWGSVQPAEIALRCGLIIVGSGPEPLICSRKGVQATGGPNPIVDLGLEPGVVEERGECSEGERDRRKL